MLISHSGHDVRAVDSVQRTFEVMRLSNNYFLATILEKADGALDLRPHAAGGELSFVEVLFTFRNIQVIQIDLFGRSEVQSNLVDIGRNNKDRRPEFAGEQAG